MYIRLSPFSDYYLAALTTEAELKWALVNVKDVITLDNHRMRKIEDFGWLPLDDIAGSRADSSGHDGPSQPVTTSAGAAAQ